MDWMVESQLVPEPLVISGAFDADVIDDAVRSDPAWSHRLTVDRSAGIEFDRRGGPWRERLVLESAETEGEVVIARLRSVERAAAPWRVLLSSIFVRDTLFATTEPK